MKHGCRGEGFRNYDSRLPCPILHVSSANHLFEKIGNHEKIHPFPAPCPPGFAFWEKTPVRTCADALPHLLMRDGFRHDLHIHQWWRQRFMDKPRQLDANGIPPNPLQAVDVAIILTNCTYPVGVLQNIHGTLTVSNDVTLDLDNNSQLNLLSGGTINVSNGSNLNVNSGVDLLLSYGTNLNLNGGNLTINNGGILFFVGTATVSVNSGGVLSVNNGGTLMDAIDPHVTNINSGGELQLNNGSILDLTNATFNLSGTLTLGNNPASLPGVTFNWNTGGTLKVANGALLNSSEFGSNIQSGRSLVVEAGGTLHRDAFLALNGTLTNSGTISSAQLDINAGGNLTLKANPASLPSPLVWNSGGTIGQDARSAGRRHLDQQLNANFERHLDQFGHP
jgi:hypothetical protein